MRARQKILAKTVEDRVASRIRFNFNRDIARMLKNKHLFVDNQYAVIMVACYQFSKVTWHTERKDFSRERKIPQVCKLHPLSSPPSPVLCFLFFIIF